MLPRDASWKSPGARGCPLRAIGVSISVPLCFSRGIMMLAGVGEANLDLTLPAFVASVLWPLEVSFVLF